MRRLRKFELTIAVLLSVFLSLQITAPILIKKYIQKKAAIRGIDVSISQVDISWRTITLVNVGLSFINSPSLQAKIPKINVGYGFSGTKTVSVPGGNVDLNGAMADVLKNIRHPQTLKENQSDSPLDLDIQEISLNWKNFIDNGELQAEGARFHNHILDISKLSVRVKSGTIEAAGFHQDTRKPYDIDVDTLKATIASIDSEPTRPTQASSWWTKYELLSRQVHDFSLHTKQSRLEYDQKWVETGELNCVVIKNPDSLNLQMQMTDLNFEDKIKINVLSLRSMVLPEENTIKLNMALDTMKTANPTLTNEAISTEAMVIEASAEGSNTQEVEIDAKAKMVKTNFKFNLQKQQESIQFALSMDPTPCQDVIDSIPSGMKSTIEGMKAQGDLAWSVQGDVDLSWKLDPSIKIKLSNGCRIISIPDSLSIKKLRKPFHRIVYDAHKDLIEVTSGPGSIGWVPIAMTSPYVALAFRTMEDPGFLAHRGFDIQAIENSIRDNIKTKKFMRGASTITMQLAKNLWLNRDKTLSRKIQEAFLTMYLEQGLEKDEILELYVNVVEFGPNMYGIGNASKHYFNKYPIDLTLGQSLFLASILPDPDASHFMGDGKLHPSKASFLRQVMKAMRDRKLISEDEYNDGIKESLKFGQSSTRDDIEEPSPKPDTEAWEINQ